MTSTVRVVDRGASRLMARLRERARAVEVGVLGADAGKQESDGVTVADVALWAEFGLGQPRRSWLADWIEANGPALAERTRIESRAVIAGDRTKAQALGRLGLWIQGQIQQRIANGIDPPNAESTIRQKESSTPLIDKGQFRSSIATRVV
tara:strand:- start:1623 stop:2072 length:450 start_codon:yes stop_codon:yes gene_type:complete